MHRAAADISPRTSRLRRILFILAGGVSLALAALGVVLPVLPTSAGSQRMPES